MHMHIDIKTIKKTQSNNYYKIVRQRRFILPTEMIGRLTECLRQKIWSQAGGPALRTEVVFPGKVGPLTWK